MKTIEVQWILVTVSFVTYFFISMVYKKLGVHNLKSALLIRNGLRFLNLKYLLGIVLFGIMSYLMMPEFNYLIDRVEIPKIPTLMVFIFTLGLSSYVSFLNVKKEFVGDGFDSLNYGLDNACFYFLIRFSFLLAYEFFFRGILLFKLLEFTSLPMAILYNTVLYVIIHSFDSRKEILGAIPFGIVLCVFSYITESVWYPFLVHLSLSAVFECYLFYHLTLKNKILS